VFMQVSIEKNSPQPPEAGLFSEVKTATKADEESIVAAIMTAFSADPPSRWIYPNSCGYLKNFPAFIRAFGGGALDAGSAHYVGDFAAAALWLPPGVEPDEEALTEIFEETVSAEIRRDLFPLFEQMGAYHPAEPHWYLPMIGADPAFQNKGFGSALLRHALAECDREGALAYLESTNPKNISLYERHGFVLQGTIQVGSSPPIFPMLRRPRP
jgi:ribosomal protein S18 acetylase RimI-like enzyme